jgi:hypothetical protein
MTDDQREYLLSLLREQRRAELALRYQLAQDSLAAGELIDVHAQIRALIEDAVTELIASAGA